MPKLQPATTEDLAEVKDAIEAELQRIRDSIPVQIQATESKLQMAIDAVTGAVRHNNVAASTNLKEAVEEAKAREGEIDKRLQADIEGLAERLTKVENGQTRLSESLQELEKKLFSTLNKELSSLCDKLDQEFDGIRGLVQTTDDKGGQTTGVLQARTKVLETRLEEAQNELVQHKEFQEALSRRLDEALEEQKKVDEKQDETSKGSFGEIHIRIDKVRESLKEQMIMAKTSSNKAMEELKAQATAIREDMESHFEDVEGSLSTLRCHQRVVESQGTRRVQWVIKEASRLLEVAMDTTAQKPAPESASSPSSSRRSWRSPRFNAGGGEGLQLELQLSEPPPQSSWKPSVEPGDCSVSLWGCPGIHFSVRLFVGEKSQHVEATFLSSNCCASTRCLGFLKDLINQESDTLIVGMELLEVIHEAEEHHEPVTDWSDDVPVPVPEEEAAADGRGDGVERAAAAETLQEVALPSQQEEGREGDASASEPPTPGHIVAMRHFNYNILDEARRQCELVRSAMVRHVHWRIEHGSALKQHFGMGDPLCSVPFSASGIEGMQFIFYPSGYKGASEGQSSLFLYCPAGTTLKAWLYMGNRRWESNNHFQVGHASGRTNFARLEKVIDESDDTVVIGIEIEEAKSEEQTTATHTAASWQATRVSEQEAEAEARMALNSSIKLVKTFNGGSSAVMEGARLLPSLWTPKPISDLLKLPHGFQTFSKLEPTRRAPPSKADGSMATSSSRRLGGSGFHHHHHSSASPPFAGGSFGMSSSYDGGWGASAWSMDTAELRASESMPALAGQGKHSNLLPAGDSEGVPLPKLVGTTASKHAKVSKRPQAVLMRMAETC